MTKAKVKKKIKKNVPVGIVHIQSSFNNTVITVTDLQGNVISWSSGGHKGFKGSRKGTPFAAQLAAEDALQKIGMGERLHSLPSKLSGGEQQRVSVARALAHEPKILFADEPTANLDSVSGASIIELFKDLHIKGQTIVMVTHEEEYAKYCDRIIYLEDGKIVGENIQKQ